MCEKSRQPSIRMSRYAVPVSTVSTVGATLFVCAIWSPSATVPTTAGEMVMCVASVMPVTVVVEESAPQVSISLMT